jgi:hypothetical protein
VDAYLAAVEEAVHGWWQERSASAPARLDARWEGDELVVHDTRRVARAAAHRLTDLQADLLMRCDTATSIAALLRSPSLAGRAAEVCLALEALADARLVYEQGGKFVTLPIFRNRLASQGDTRDADTAAVAAEQLLPVV